MKTLYLALLLATTAAHALSDSEKETLMTAEQAYKHQDYATALEKWQTLAEAGDAEAQYIVGKFYADAGEWQNAIFWLNKSADQGNAQALSETAMAYLDGRDGVPKDANQGENGNGFA